MKKESPKNFQLAKLIQEIKKLSIEQNIQFWKRIAQDLEKPTRQRRIVNLFKINQNTKDGETVIIPGKVLGTGELEHKVTVAAYNFSKQAFTKINAKGSAISIQDLIKKNPKASKVKILG